LVFVCRDLILRTSKSSVGSLRANEAETNALKEILDTYANNASGQMINMNKSEIFFSRNVSSYIKDLSLQHLIG
jgi:hypothetical protein